MELGHSSTPRGEVSTGLCERASGDLSKNRSWQGSIAGFEQVALNFKIGIAVVVKVMSWLLGWWPASQGPCSWAVSGTGANFSTCPRVGPIASPEAPWRDGDLQLCCSRGCWPSPSAWEQHMLFRAVCGTAGPAAMPLLTAHLQTSVTSYPGIGYPCSTAYSLATRLVSLKASRNTHEVRCHSL